MNPDQLLLEILQEVQRDVKCIRETQLEQGFDIKSNKEDLAVHMKRTELNEDYIKIVEKRVEVLEEDKKLKKFSWKLIGWIGSGIVGFTSFIYTLYSFYLKSHK